jgi:hypothetical protein
MRRGLEMIAEMTQATARRFTEQRGASEERLRLIPGSRCAAHSFTVQGADDTFSGAVNVAAPHLFGSLINDAALVAYFSPWAPLSIP